MLWTAEAVEDLKKLDMTFINPVTGPIYVDGAKKDGIIRHHRARRDGTVRDSVMYSILANEWPDVKQHLEQRLIRHGNTSK